MKNPDKFKAASRAMFDAVFEEIEAVESLAGCEPIHDEMHRTLDDLSEEFMQRVEEMARRKFPEEFARLQKHAAQMADDCPL